MTDPARLLDFLGGESTLRSTDDVLALTLPLLEQAHALHQRGKVAPLEGVDEILVASNRLFFEDAKAKAPRTAERALTALRSNESLAFEVAGHFRRMTDDDGTSTEDLAIAEAGAKLERPAYLTRYVCWEHELGHHDPLTDIFILGLVLASVALDANLGEAAALERFVSSRRGLLARTTRLHPVVARVIVRMTELERSGRVQDLGAVITTLRNYREQTLDGSDDVVAGHRGDGPVARQRWICEKLRDRLFDFSRRNRLLYFSPSGQTLNLTVASVPLVLDVKSVSPDALFTWAGRAAADVASGKPVPLGRYLRFEDYPYVASALDQLRLDANRMKAEVGYSPLRLVVCFLHWHDLKQAPEGRITSPLLLLRATLEKKKGVRDAVFLAVESSEAEVNPVLRQLLQQLYGVRLPERVDVANDREMKAFEESLVDQIRASEPAVVVARREKPRIDMVLAQAKRRLDAYRKRAALSGRAVRSHRGFDYSYARSKLHPLGVQMFAHLVYPASAPNRELVDAPRPRIFQNQPEPAVVEKSLYSLHAGADGGGPYEWALDFCSVTLANFNYRKMSLVRDYAGLIEATTPQPSFDELFAEEARPVLSARSAVSTMDSFAVMPADPTQASAIARARDGTWFIIQGPPGTGKSQTITNLVSDYVARGKRVLFVCEKRAAIDVVHHRLRMQGLASLCTLIHDSHADKKTFIKELKETYEAWIAEPPGRDREEARAAAAAAYSAILDRSRALCRVMQEAPDGADAPLLNLLARSVELEDTAPVAIPAEALPSLRDFTHGAPLVRAIETGLAAVGCAPELGRHPLRALADAVLLGEDPGKTARDEARALAATFEEVTASALVRIGDVGTTGEVVARLRLLDALRPLVEAKLLKLLDASSDAHRALVAIAGELRSKADALTQATRAAAGWTQLLPADEAATALAQARRFEGSFVARVFGWLSPSWWRLRRVLAASFDFASKSIKPTWTDVLERLRDRYAAEEAVRAVRDRARDELSVDDVEKTRAAIEAADAAGAPDLRAWFATAAGRDSAGALLRVADRARDLEDRLGHLVRDAGARSPAALGALLAAIDAHIADLPAILEPLRRLAAPELRKLAAVARDHAVTCRQIERAVLRQSIDGALRRAAQHTLGGGDLDSLQRSAIEHEAKLRRANADAIVERAKNRFLENVRISAAPAGTLGPDQKKAKKAYAAGRKELEHEFGKVTRFRSIRDLATGDAGTVAADLKPVWLMSPLSVADTLPLAPIFDVVIFDEASQIPLEDAVPAAQRAAQAIVVGDEMQLPPTDFFGAKGGLAGDDDERPDFGFELDASSLLTHAAQNLPSTMLGWHYRSRDEALIAFSNRVFYDGKLLTVPAVAPVAKRRPIVAREPKDGELAADALLERTLSHHFIEDAPYEQRRNPKEAGYIAEMLRGLLAKNHGLTIGVVAFSEAQQDEIEAALRELGEQDPAFRARYEAELEREEDGQQVGLFVKNLENVQGDERDIIVISVCYGPDARGKMLMNFGPINKMGGEKRLNVIFSRAKRHLALVSSIRWSAITNEYNDGANCLRNYLRYAEAMSVGDAAQAELALQGYGKIEAGEAAELRALERKIAAALRERGHEVDVGVGASRFRCNLAVRARGEGRYRLGVFIDDRAFYERPVSELMVVQPSVLDGFGWKTMTVLHRDWYEDPELVIKRILTALASPGA